MHKYFFLLALVCGCCIKGFSQQPVDTAFHKLDSLSKKTDSLGYQKNNIKGSAYNNITRLSTRDYFILLGSDLKQELTKPFHMTHADWLRAGKFTVLTIGLGFVDEPIQKEALRLRNKSKAIRSVGNYVSRFGGLYEAYTLAVFGTYGILFKNQKVKTSTLLASQAYISAAVIERIVKTFSGRTRPNYYAAYTEAEPTFKGPFNNKTKSMAGSGINSSFPSGHTTVAFAAATVFAKEYANRPLIPVIAYSAASLIGLSRITENKHWFTDVVAGAVLGYLTGRQVVNNYHRFAKLKNKDAKKGNVSFNMQYNYGKILPGVVYTFR